MGVADKNGASHCGRWRWGTALSRAFSGKQAVLPSQACNWELGAHPSHWHTYLNNGFGPSHFKHLATPLSPIREGKVDNLCILGKLLGRGATQGKARVTFHFTFWSQATVCLSLM